MGSFDYITAINDRLLVLVQAHPPAAAMYRAANMSQPGDTRQKPVVISKGSNAVGSDFPKLVLRVGNAEESAWGDPKTIGLDEGVDIDEQITQEYVAVVTHAAENTAINAANDLEVATAFRKGLRQLADPNVADSGLDYVVAWGPLRFNREIAWAYNGTRQITRITIPVIVQMYASELNA